MIGTRAWPRCGQHVRPDAQEGLAGDGRPGKNGVGGAELKDRPRETQASGAGPAMASGGLDGPAGPTSSHSMEAVSYTHLRAHETSAHL
eukprot:14109812-Alexandrium_andersonii.AAC.1